MAVARRITPFQLDVLLHYYTVAEDHPKIKLAVFKEVAEDLIKDSLLEPSTPQIGFDTKYQVTQRGALYLESILSMPLPIAVWAMPADVEYVKHARVEKK